MKSTTGESENLSHSLTDLMTSLMVIFILLLVIYLNNTSRAVADVREQLFTDLAKELGTIGGVTVEKDPKDPLSIVVMVPQDLLGFELNKSNVPPKGELFLSTTIPKMANLLCGKKFSSKIDSITVEGHTDSSLVPGKSRTYSEGFNLKLSQERSLSVVEACLESIKNSGEQYTCFVDRLSASGRGQRDPILLNGAEDFDKSRRVIFKIRVKSSEQLVQKELNNLYSVPGK